MTTADHKPRRSLTQATALRRFAMTWAWDQAYHCASIYAPGTDDVRAKARALLAQGWVEAKLAERHGHLVVIEAAAPAPAPVVRPVGFVRREV